MNLHELIRKVLSSTDYKLIKKILIMSNCVFVFTFLFCLRVSAGGYSQNNKVSLDIENTSLKKALSILEKKGNIRLLYSESNLPSDQQITIQIKDTKVVDVLQLMLKDTNIKFRVFEEGLVVLSPANKEIPDLQITGSVSDETGITLPGVSVKLKGTSIVTTTDVNGVYNITVPDAKGILVFTYIGFTTREIAINNQTKLDVKLNSSSQSLNEVVVVGYGTVAKKDLTSAATTVTSKDFLQGAFNSPLQLIEGKIAGITTSNPASADPNRGLDIQVRGAASLEAGNGPLIVLDGMAGADLRNVAQQDIESITVLKDASASAIYGSRGANGVVIVQTKRGKSGKVAVTYDSYIEHDYVAAKPSLLSAEQFLEKKIDDDRGAQTNWYDKLIRKDNFGQNQYLAVSGGGENSMFRISGNYRTKTAIDIASDRKESGFRANFLQKAMDGLLEVGGNVSYRIASEEFTNYNAFQQAVKLNPTIPVMDPANPLKYNTLQGYDTFNPVQNLLARENGADHTYSVVDFNVKLNLLKNLTTDVKLARQGHDRDGREYYSSQSAESIQNNRIGRARLQNEKWTDYTLEWLGNYNQSFGKHDLKLLGGYSYQEFNEKGFWAENSNFPSDAFGYNYLQGGSWNLEKGRLGMESRKSKEKTIAFLGRANYNFNDTYFLTGSFRYEGNTKFGANNKWGLFPAISGAWRISKLPFIQNIKSINDLKLRLSYGETGRSGFPRYTSLPRYVGYGRYLNDEGQWIQVYGPANNFNSNLQWEKAISYNAGLDFSLFNYKLTGSIDVFNRKSTNLLSNYDVPVGSYVQEQIFVNVGSTSAKGVELALAWKPLQGKTLNYSTNLTGSYTKAKLDSWSNNEFSAGYRYFQNLPSPGNPGPAYRLEAGKEIGSFYGYKYAGVDDKGNIMIWKNAVEGSERINATNEGDSNRDRTYLGHGAPRFELGWGNTLDFKQFDLSFLFRGRFDYQILNLYQMYYGLQAEPGVNLLKDAYERNGQIKSGKVVTDYFLESGDFVKLDNVTLGWSPKLNIKRINSLRFYGTIRNVFTITKYTGLDPTSVSVTGLTPGYQDLNVYPVARTFSFGAQINF